MDLDSILEKASKLKIAVIGDLIIDHYIYGKANRLSPEAPVAVVEPFEEEIKMGGAGNVFMNLMELTGVDLYCNALSNHPFDGIPGFNFNYYPCSRKTRIMSGNHHMLRIDRESEESQIEWLPFKSFEWWEMLQQKFGEYNCIILADYHKGVLSDSLINAIIELAKHYNIPVIVDAKKQFGRYRGATVIKCNEKEYKNMDRCSRMGHTAEQAAQALDIKWFVVTQGEGGICFFSCDGDGQGIAGYPIKLIDVCGAGDTVTAILAMVIAADETIRDAIDLANIAASEVVQHSGVHPITKEELIRRYKEVQQWKYGNKNSD